MRVACRFSSTGNGSSGLTAPLAAAAAGVESRLSHGSSGGLAGLGADSKRAVLSLLYRTELLTLAVPFPLATKCYLS